jgi:hypothetical protein
MLKWGRAVLPGLRSFNQARCTSAPRTHRTCTRESGCNLLTLIRKVEEMVTIRLHLTLHGADRAFCARLAAALADTAGRCIARIVSRLLQGTMQVVERFNYSLTNCPEYSRAPFSRYSVSGNGFRDSQINTRCRNAPVSEHQSRIRLAATRALQAQYCFVLKQGARHFSRPSAPTALRAVSRGVFAVTTGAKARPRTAYFNCKIVPCLQQDAYMR